MTYLYPLFDDTSGNFPYVNVQLHGEINTRLATVQSSLGSANALLSLILEANSRLSRDTARELLPQIQGLALGIVDQVHIAANIAKSLRNISAYAVEAPSGNRISGPHTLESLNPDLVKAIRAACNDLDIAFKDVKGIRDTAHHADERIDRKARFGKVAKDIKCDGPICIGTFAGGEVLSIHSTAVVRGSPEETNDSIPGYLAVFELSKKSLDTHAEMIRKVFSCLPYAEPLPNLI